jgi:hypothetical protein
MQALFALLQASATFPTAGRRLVFWNKVAEQPALFLRNVGEEWIRGPTRLPPKLLIDCEIWLYCNSGSNPDQAPAVGMNGLIDAVTAAIAPCQGQEAQTLGGLVTHCWIEGKTDIHPGDLDGQAIAVIPVKILVPNLGG